MTVKPVRLQRSRRKGAHLESPNGLPIVYVDRTNKKYGNPYRIGDPDPMVIGFRMDRRAVIRMHQWHVAAKLQDDPHWLDELRGCNLACYCKLTEECHADFLLEIANRSDKPANRCRS